MTDPKPCERCGQGDCPTLAYLTRSVEERLYASSAWDVAFQACATMGRKVAADEANRIAVASLVCSCTQKMFYDNAGEHSPFCPVRRERESR